MMEALMKTFSSAIMEAGQMPHCAGAGMTLKASSAHLKANATCLKKLTTGKDGKTAQGIIMTLNMAAQEASKLFTLTEETAQETLLPISTTITA